jgi:multidrug efflux pump subunit AcrA (membrane-fusion protein)
MEFIDLNANTIFLKKETVRATFQGFIVNILKNIGDDVKSGEALLVIKTKESDADDSLRLHLGNYTFQGFVKVRARSDGVLTALNYHSGDYVSDGEEIAIISDPSSLRISLNVPYQYVAKIPRDRQCNIFLPDSTTLPATIQKVIPSVDPASQTQTFLLKMLDGAHLPENLNVTARVPLRTVKNALTIPRSAVMSNETLDQFWVMKLLDDSKAFRVDIRKGIENDSLVQIIEPELNISDLIISDGAFGLPDTARVTINR